MFLQGNAPTPTSLREWLAWAIAAVLGLFSLRKEFFASIETKLDKIDGKIDGLVATAASHGERIARLEVHAESCDMVVVPSPASPITVATESVVHN
jgi:hypothetical protein